MGLTFTRSGIREQMRIAALRLEKTRRQLAALERAEHEAARLSTTERGRKGASVRNSRLTAERRSEIARQASAARRPRYVSARWWPGLPQGAGCSCLLALAALDAPSTAGEIQQQLVRDGEMLTLRQVRVGLRALSRNGHPGLLGWRCVCACGQSYYHLDPGGDEQDCPDAGVAWREPEEPDMMADRG